MVKRTALGEARLIATEHGLAMKSSSVDRGIESTVSPSVNLSMGLLSGDGQQRSAPNTTRITITDHPWQYMLVQIHFSSPDGPPLSFDEVQFKNTIVGSLRKAYGIVGASVVVDVLRFQPNQSYIRVPFEHASVVSSSLALCSEYDGLSCRISVVRQSPFLCSLVAGTR
ncbi:hypothetical protein BASA50_005403 [Batrachochytrium salamandrivorans]|uniref:Ribonucleases P/MRP subunit Pop8-like domain-containing protein n=1 Tax=Batrachochytrium salamandrivorans TaxID=1357716 RepID=A0ABQ8FCW2_9FUNG|nr:hypothetical protein BASA50_005403 [Batrachochytrium salamandrivorans]